MSDATASLEDWVSRLADEVVAEAAKRGTTVVCASGLSPSGVIHLGNLREVMSPHLVADELQRRGVEVEHLISWDDYDRFRKVPAGIDGVDDSWAAHVGKPLTSVPPPPVPLTRTGPPTSRRRRRRASRRSASATAASVRRSSTRRAPTPSRSWRRCGCGGEIDAILAQYRTLPGADDDETQAALNSGSGAATEDDGSGGAEYYPYKPYCTVCGTDNTTITAYDDDTTEMTYTCACGHTETVLLRDFRSGKLVWKVDWPMRWAYEKVVFEPSGVDHQSPGSSFAVGLELAPLFGWERPYGPGYSFVGFGGVAKISSSRGGAPDVEDALRVMEAPVLRWQYARRRMNQSFDVAFGSELQRLYDEWDALDRKIAAGAAGAAEIAAHARAIGTAEGPLPVTPHPIAFRTLASLVDLSTGDAEQLLRLVQQMDDSVASLDELQPRLNRVETWVATQMPPEERTTVRATPDTEALAALTPEEHEAIALLLDGGRAAAADLRGMDSGWTDPPGLRRRQGAARP